MKQIVCFLAFFVVIKVNFSYAQSHNSIIATFLDSSLVNNEILKPLILAFLAGLVTAFSPCIYPLIPITLSVMGVNRKQSHLKSFLIAATYVLAMILIYAFLGALCASLGIIAGSLMHNTFILLLLAALFFFMALSMLDILSLRLPATLLMRLNRIGGSGFKGAFLMGLVAGAIATPCTGPVLASILALIAHDQDLFLGIILMIFFALGLGIPFLLLGTFSNILILPKAGAWMNTVKIILASAIFALSAYFLAQAFEPVRIILGKVAAQSLIYSLLFILAGILISKNTKFIGVILCSLGFISLFFSQESTFPDNNKWHIIDEKNSHKEDLDLILKEAQENSRPVLIDFHAQWCSECVKLSLITLKDKKIQTRLSDFVLIKIDATKDSRLINDIFKRFDIKGLPTLLIIDADQKRPLARIVGFISPQALLSALDSY